jgi:hypothetical protein
LGRIPLDAADRLNDVGEGSAMTAAVHAGDWLVKLGVISIIVGLRL